MQSALMLVRYHRVVDVINGTLEVLYILILYVKLQMKFNDLNHTSLYFFRIERRR